MTPFISAGAVATSAVLSLTLSDIVIASRSAHIGSVICNAPRIEHCGPLETVSDAAFWSALNGEPQTAADIAEIQANLTTFGRLLTNQMRLNRQGNA